MTDDAPNPDDPLGRADQENSEYDRQTTAEWDAIDRRDRVGRLLNHGGWSDVLVLRHEAGRDVLVPDRLKIIHSLREHGDTPIDINTLAQDLNRDPSALVDDLTRLAELDIVSLNREDGSCVTLTHQHVVVDPIY